jgi:hypothetical protein
MKRMAIAATAALLSSAADASVTELVIYKDNDFKGASQVVKGEVAHLEDGFAAQAASLVARGGYWEVCNRSHFKGDCRVLAEGEYARLDPGWTRRIVSTRFLGKRVGAVDLYAGAAFAGQPVRVHDNVRDLAERNFDGGSASAVVHEGTWVACSDPGFHGRCTVLSPGRYPHLGEVDQRVSSLRQLR